MGNNWQGDDEVFAEDVWTYIDFRELTDEEREEFVRGFRDADMLGVDDWDSSTPWGCPWFWRTNDRNYVDGDNAYDWGRSWFEQCSSEIEEEMKKSKELEDLEDIRNANRLSE